MLQKMIFSTGKDDGAEAEDETYPHVVASMRWQMSQGPCRGWGVCLPENPQEARRRLGVGWILSIWATVVA